MSETKDKSSPKLRRRLQENGSINGGVSDGGAEMTVQQDINLQRIRDKAMCLKTEALENIDSQLQELLDEFVQEVERLQQSPSEHRKKSHKQRKQGELPDKEFISRRSVLTELLEMNHIRTIYHIFVAILIVFTLNTIVYDIADKGRLVLDFSLIRYSFGNFPMVMYLWGCMKLAATCLIYPTFQYWATNRRPGKTYWWDYAWLAVYVAYQVTFMVLPVRYLNDSNLPPGSSVVIVCEQVRLVMKQHAFVRENIPRVLQIKGGEDDGSDSTPLVPDYSKYLYFLFAPTLVYRDSYPRTQGPIRWGYVVSNFTQVLACLFYTYYIFERFCVPVFRNFNEEHLTPKRLILSMFGSMLPGTLVLFIAFFAILHSWLNAFAEMLRFADRLFYKDWWNSSSFASYYRTWNVVVHDWLYSYVYKDCYKLVGAPNRPAAMASVFLLSALFHEYILSVALKFFYPVLFFMFAGAGFAFIFIPSKAQRSGNVFMWVSLFLGTGVLMCLYSMEWYARKNCPAYVDSFADYLIPRSWVCDFASIKK